MFKRASLFSYVLLNFEYSLQKLKILSQFTCFYSQLLGAQFLIITKCIEK